MWLEHTARSSNSVEAYPFPIASDELDFRPLLAAVAHDRARGTYLPDIARAFQRGIAQGLCRAVKALCEGHGIDTVVLSGGVFQNEMLLEDVKFVLESEPIRIWTNAAVPPNDGGISLGQAALGAFAALRNSNA